MGWKQRLKFLMGRPGRHRSLLHQAISRQLSAFLITLAMTVLSVYLLYTYSINQAAEQGTKDAVKFYTVRIAELEQQWQEEAIRSKARLEFMRILEDPASRWARLASYLTTQSTGGVGFSLLAICDSNDRVLFKTGHGNENLPEIITRSSFSGWYFNPSTTKLHRVYRQSIWLGPEGMGGLVLFRPMDHSLLYKNAFPDTFLFLSLHGRVISSSLGEQGTGEIQPGYDGTLYRGGKRYEQRTLEWEEEKWDSPRLEIQLLIQNPFSPREVLIAAILILVIFALSLWSAFGLWMVRTTRRILFMGRFSREFMKDYGLLPDLQYLIQASRIQGEDEINEVARSLQEMASAVVQRDEARQEKEQILVESEKRIREITSILAEGLFVLDHKGILTFMNPEAERLVGWSEAEVLGKHGHELFHDHHQNGTPFSHTECVVHKTLRTGQRQRMDEDWFVCRNGSFLPVSIIASPILRKGQVFGSVVAFRDITERKRAAQALRESEEKYRLLVENIDAVVFWGYWDWGVDFFDNKIEAVSGYAREDFETRKLRWLDLFFEQDVESAKKEFRDALKTGKSSYAREYRIRRKDGKTIWVHERGHFIFDEHLRVKSVSGLFFDITDRKTVEEALAFERQQLLSIFDSIGEPIFVTDPKTYDLLFINRATQTLFGDVTGRKCFKALQEMDSPCDFCTAGHSPGELPGRPHTRESRNQVNQRWYRTTERAIRWPDGRMAHCEMAFDINDLKLAELELRKAHDELEMRVARRTEDLHTANRKLNQEIMERGKAEAVLRESEGRFRLLFENAKDSIFWADTDSGLILACNRSAESLVERCKEEIIGEHLAVLYPEDKAGLYADLFKGIEGKGFENTEAQVITRNGKTKEVQISASVTLVGGKPIIQGIFRDITELKMAERSLKESERYLSTVMDTMHVGVVIIDPESHLIVDANRHAARMVGIERKELIGHVCHNYLCPVEAGKCPVTDLGEEIDNTERVLQTSGGTPMPILKSVAKIIKDKRTYLVESFIDISDLKLLLKEQELDIALAKNILNLANGGFPRYIDLTQEVALASCAISLPCHREGGDHYFMCEAPENNAEKGARTFFSLKDQSGHKVGCLLRSILTDLLHHAILKSPSGDTLEESVTLLNTKICEHKIFKDIDFVTAINGEIEHETLMLRYVLCGHSGFLVISGDEVISLPQKGASGKNLPLGTLRNAFFDAGHFKLKPGDKVILYTDGLAEANYFGPRSENDPPFSMLDLKDIAREIVNHNKTLPVLDIMREMIARVSKICRKRIHPSGFNETADDITLMGMEIEPKKGYLEEAWSVRNLQELQERIDDFLGRQESEWMTRGYEKPLRLRYALSEAVLNAWKHGNGRDPDKRITLRYRYGSDYVLEIIDEGAGFDRGTVPDPRYGDRLYKDGGRGILLIKRYATSAKWSEKSSRLVMTFDRSSQPSYLSIDTVEENIGL